MDNRCPNCVLNGSLSCSTHGPEAQTKDAEIARLRAELNRVRLERLQIQRAIAATAVGGDGSEDDDVEYTVTEMVGWIQREHDWRVNGWEGAKAEVASLRAELEQARKDSAEWRQMLDESTTTLKQRVEELNQARRECDEAEDEIERLMTYAKTIQLGAHSAYEVLDGLKRERDSAIARAVEIGEQLEFDRSAVADCLTKANRAIDSRHWLTEGRGSYGWDDDRWHDEFRAAAREIKAALAPLTRIAADWKNCPQTTEAVIAARIDWKQRAGKDEAALKAAREALRRIYEGACRQLAEPRNHEDDQYALHAIATEVEVIDTAREVKQK